MSFESYIENEVLSATPQQLVVMLYDGAIKFLKRLDNIDYKREIEVKNYNINKAHAIISELQQSLDMEYKEISGNLFSLYSFMNQQLVEANMENNPKKIENVISMLEELKGSWIQVMTKLTKQVDETFEEDKKNASDMKLEENMGFSMAC